MRLNHMADLLSDYHATLNKALRQLTQEATDLESDVLDPDCLWEMYVTRIISNSDYHLSFTLSNPIISLFTISACNSKRAKY
jgi:hypothetical protein